MPTQKKTKKKLIQKDTWEFLLWHSRLMIWLVSVAVLFKSPVQCCGLRIWHCHSCSVGCSCSSDLNPGLGTSTSPGCRQKRPKKKKKNTCTSKFIAPLITIAKIWKQPKCLSMKKWWRCRIHITYNKILLSH